MFKKIIVLVVLLFGSESLHSKDFKENKDKEKEFMQYCTTAKGEVLYTINYLGGREKLLKETCELIYKEYVKGSQVIKLSDNKITNIDILKFFSGREVLLYNTSIKDITPLGEMERFEYLESYNNSAIDISSLKDTNIKELYISKVDIKNFKSISQIKSLQSLKIEKALITDISPLKYLESLQNLRLIKIKVNDISPLKEIKNLKSLVIEDTPVTDISPLKYLESLQNLRLIKIKVNDISPLKEIKNLKSLVIEDTPITDISSLAGMQNLAIKIDSSKLKGCSPQDSEDIIKGISCYNKDGSKKKHTKKKDFMKYCTNAKGAALHTIKQLAESKHLKKACKLIYKKYVKNGHSIVLAKKKITNLEVFKFFSSIELTLNDNDIKDITPLGEMESLGYLVLDNNPISDISPLKNKNSNLYMLSILNTNIVDLKSLSNAKSLRKIMISGVKSLKSIKGLINLEELSIIKSELMDITDIKGFKSLMELTIQNAPLVDISPISNLTNLSNINLAYVSVSYIPAIKKGSEYLSLSLNNTKINDLSSFNSERIIYLKIKSNKLKWCSPQKKFDFINKVSCYNKDGSEKVEPKKYLY